MNEANYGLRYIQEYVEGLRPNASVLEIGSGPSVLLSHLSSTFKSCSFTGVEPIGPGFESFRASLNHLKDNFSFKLFEGGYEDFRKACTEKFDLIFLVNVFEHLPDWRNFLEFVKVSLNDGGKCVILCPNYSFPYESHFGIPIVINKSVTYVVFGGFIDNFETNNSASGLWSSPNFVKLRDVKRVSERLGFGVKINNKIINDLIDRLSYDEEFFKRQRAIGRIAKPLKALGVLKLFELYPLVLFQPYMYLEISLNRMPK